MSNWRDWFVNSERLRVGERSSSTSEAATPSAGIPMWRDYHDKEWGQPVHDDRRLFEYLLMECMSCGLSWGLMMKKREVFRSVFADYDFHKVAAFSEEDIEKATAAEGMIHSQRKVEGIVNNAKRMLEVIAEFGSFDRYIGRSPMARSFATRRMRMA